MHSCVVFCFVSMILAAVCVVLRRALHPTRWEKNSWVLVDIIGIFMGAIDPGILIPDRELRRKPARLGRFGGQMIRWDALKVGIVTWGVPKPGMSCWK